MNMTMMFGSLILYTHDQLHPLDVRRIEQHEQAFEDHDLQTVLSGDGRLDHPLSHQMFLSGRFRRWQNSVITFIPSKFVKQQDNCRLACLLHMFAYHCVHHLGVT